MSEVVNCDGIVTEKSANELVFVPRAELVKKTVARLSGGRRVFTVTDENVARLHPELLPERDVCVLKAGEDSKTFSSAENVCRKMLEAGITRGAIVVAVGGGVVGDLAGFVASVYMRGVEFINVPTTLLSQVDSSIGGKTGVNLDGYKNMLGAFKMPTSIVICPEVLSSLPEREWRCGMGELIKTAALEPELYAFVTQNINGLMEREPSAVEKAVKAAASFKKKITDDDPTEKGNRMILNLGHTVGHALEKCDSHKLSHGEYVMLGIELELYMTQNSNSDFRDSICALLKKAGTPELPRFAAEEVCFAAKSDKKNTDGKITLLGELGAGKVFVSKVTNSEFVERYKAAVKIFDERRHSAKGKRE